MPLFPQFLLQPSSQTKECIRPELRRFKPTPLSDTQLRTSVRAPITEPCPFFKILLGLAANPLLLVQLISPKNNKSRGHDPHGLIEQPFLPSLKIRRYEGILPHAILTQILVPQNSFKITSECSVSPALKIPFKFGLSTPALNQ